VAAHAQSLATRRGEFLAMAHSRLCLTLRALRVDEAEAGTGSGEAGGQERGSAAQRGSAEAGGAAQDVPAQGRRIAGGQGDSFDDTSSWQERGEELAAEQPYLPQRQPEKLREPSQPPQSGLDGGRQTRLRPDGREADARDAANASAVPPTSALVTRVFGAGRSQSTDDNAAPRGNPARSGRAGRPSPDADRARKLREAEAQLQERQQQLEVDAQKLKRDRAAVAQQRVALEQREGAFKRAQGDAVAKLEDERRQFETFKAEEIRKMKRDRRNEERIAARGATQAASEKRQREELQAQVDALQAAAQAKESRSRLQEGRLRSQIDELKKRNAELEGDLAYHEQQRLARWKAEDRGPTRDSAASSSVLADGGPPEAGGDDAAVAVLKGIDSRLRDSMERSRGLADELQRRSWDSEGASSTLQASNGAAEQANEQKRQLQQRGEQTEPQSTPGLEAVGTDHDAPRQQIADSDPDPRVRGRDRPKQAHSIVRDTADDAAAIEREWNELVESMPSLTPVAEQGGQRRPTLIYEQHHPDGKLEQARNQDMSASVVVWLTMASVRRNMLAASAASRSPTAPERKSDPALAMFGGATTTAAHRRLCILAMGTSSRCAHGAPLCGNAGHPAATGSERIVASRSVWTVTLSTSSTVRAPRR